jgi:hypothetical protein
MSTNKKVIARAGYLPGRVPVGVGDVCPGTLHPRLLHSSSSSTVVANLDHSGGHHSQGDPVTRQVVGEAVGEDSREM